MTHSDPTQTSPTTPPPAAGHTTAPPAPHAHARPLSPLQKISRIAADIKLAHSIFALPFAVLGAALAAHDLNRLTPLTPADLAGRFALITVCMVAARTWAMLVNRLADRTFDAKNPRTAQRAFASGAVDAKTGYAALATSALVFLIASAAFGPAYDNWWPLIGSPIILLWLAFYSFTKRFTAACHLVLGTALALSPIAAAVAIGGIEAVTIPTTDATTTATTTAPNAAAIWLIAAMIAPWVAGFDVIYALADRDFDRANNLRSLPAALGWNGAANTARALHAAAAAALVAAWWFSPTLSVAFAAAAVATIALLITEHALLAIRREKGINAAFFTLNGIVAVLLGLAGIADAVT